MYLRLLSFFLSTPPPLAVEWRERTRTSGKPIFSHSNSGSCQTSWQGTKPLTKQAFTEQSGAVQLSNAIHRRPGDAALKRTELSVSGVVDQHDQDVRWILDAERRWDFQLRLDRFGVRIGQAYLALKWFWWQRQHTVRARGSGLGLFLG